jgi:hypothetical protein
MIKEASSDYIPSRKGCQDSFQPVKNSVVHQRVHGSHLLQWNIRWDAKETGSNFSIPTAG